MEGYIHGHEIPSRPLQLSQKNKHTFQKSSIGPPTNTHYFAEYKLSTTINEILCIETYILYLERILEPKAILYKEK